MRFYRRATEGHSLGAIFTITSGAVTCVVTTGSPADIAWTREDAILLASALNLHTPNDPVLESLRTGSVRTVVSVERAAGGVHRQPVNTARTPAAGTPQLFSWADGSRDG